MRNELAAVEATAGKLRLAAFNANHSRGTAAFPESSDAGAGQGSTEVQPGRGSGKQDSDR